MQKQKNVLFGKKKLYAAILICLYSLFILCACTKKEELVLLTQNQEETADASGNGQDISGAPEGGAQDAPAVYEEITEAGESAGVAYIVEEKRTVYVHVCGAVMSPGVYELPAGSRVYEAVRAAGGFTEDAEESYVNQAQELTDGGKLLIPTVEEAQNGEIPDTLTGIENGLGIGLQAGEETQVGTDDGRININRASVEELCRIPGVGATRAAAIIAYREKHGDFESPEDIMKVSGIKEGTYGKIKDSISVK